MSNINNPFDTILRRLDEIDERLIAVSSKLEASPAKDRIGGIDLACEVLKGIYSKQTIYSLVSAKNIPHSKRGKMLVFSEKALLEWVTENKKETKSEFLKKIK